MDFPPGTSTVFHTAPAEVVATAEYTRWIATMQTLTMPNAEHVMFNAVACQPKLAFASAASLQ